MVKLIKYNVILKTYPEQKLQILDERSDHGVARSTKTTETGCHLRRMSYSLGMGLDDGAWPEYTFMTVLDDVGLAQSHLHNWTL